MAVETGVRPVTNRARRCDRATGGLVTPGLDQRRRLSTQTTSYPRKGPRQLLALAIQTTLMLRCQRLGKSRTRAADIAKSTRLTHLRHAGRGHCNAPTPSARAKGLVAERVRAVLLYLLILKS